MAQNTSTNAKQKSNTLFLGIDLGTSRSAVAADNGNKTCVDSYVGWPKDFVARKVVGKAVLFGKEALTHRLSLDVCRPLEHGVIKEGTAQDEQAVKELIKHLVELAKPAEGQKVRAVVGVPAESLKISKLAIKRAVAGYTDSLMIASEPFTVAYGLNMLTNAVVIDIGAGTVDVCIMHGTMPGEEEQRTLLTAGDYIDEQLFGMLREKLPNARFNTNMIRQFKENYSFVGEPPERVEVEIPVEGMLTKHDITSEMRRACEGILAPIVETVNELIANFDPEFQDKVRRNVIVAGGGSQIRGIGEYLQRALGEKGDCQVTCVEDPMYGGVEGALALARDLPEESWEQL